MTDNEGNPLQLGVDYLLTKNDQVLTVRVMYCSECRVMLVGDQSLMSYNCDVWEASQLSHKIKRK